MFDDKITKFTKSVFNIQEPLRIPVKTADFSIQNQCFFNVKKYCELYGGDIKYGWRIRFPYPKIMIEAEFHAVWLSNSGELIDISKSDCDETLFVIDNKLKFEGKLVPSIRRSLVNDVLVGVYILFCQMAEKFRAIDYELGSKEFFNYPEEYKQNFSIISNIFRLNIEKMKRNERSSYEGRDFESIDYLNFDKFIRKYLKRYGKKPEKYEDIFSLC
jgi:hypothetical protein